MTLSFATSSTVLMSLVRSGGTEVGVLLDDGPDEDDDLHPAVRAKEVHEGVNDRLSHVGEAAQRSRGWP